MESGPLKSKKVRHPNWNGVFIPQWRTSNQTVCFWSILVRNGIPSLQISTYYAYVNWPRNLKHLNNWKT